MYWEITAVVIVLVLFFLFVYVENKDVRYTTITIGEKRLKAEIADTFFKKTKGLMFRNEIGSDAMLFVNSYSQKSGIWMSNMRFPIDIIWANDKVVDIVQNAQPCTLTKCPIYYPKDEAQYIIEVPANWTKENKINVGTKVKIDNV